MYQQRPTGVTIIAVLFFIGGALGVLSGFLVLAMPIPATDPLTGLVASYQIAIGIVVILVAGLRILIGWGLWTLQNWARIAAMVWLALGLIGNLMSGISLLIGVNVQGFRVSYPGGGVALLLLAVVEGWLIWYLATPDVAAAFTGAWSVGLPPTILQPAAVPPPPLPISLPTAPMAPSPRPPTMPAAPPPRPAAAPVPRHEPTERMGVPSQPAGWLVARSGSRSGQSFGLKQGNNTVGRDPQRADIVLDEPTVSGEHARVRYEGGQFYLYDLASSNGTFVNNRRVQRQMLMDDDVVRFGSAELVFKKV